MALVWVLYAFVELFLYRPLCPNADHPIIQFVENQQ